MKQNSELMRIVASGGLTLMLNEMQAISNTDTLARLGTDFLKWLRVELAGSGSLAFAVSEQTLGILWDEVQASSYYAPVLRAQVPPLVEGAGVTGGNTLVADAAPGGYTIMVYKFNGKVFEVIGSLDSSPTPGAGNYVLVCAVSTEVSEIGLPTSFLTLTS